MRPRAIAALLSFLIASAHAGAEKTAPLTASDYEVRTIRGWEVHVEKSLADHPRQADALALLERKLAEVETTVPAAILPSLKQVHFWISRNVAPGACYHPSAVWLRENGRVVEMAESIELQNLDHFIDWSAAQPQMVLHELTHAWHDRSQPQGYGNPEILAAFQIAKESGKYEKVGHVSGKEQRHYAMSNAMEYLAECSEAYFGRNDFQPFDRAELKEFDPGGYALVEKIWKIAVP